MSTAGTEAIVDATGAAGSRTVGGRYRLLAQIGQGGMGRVWEARDTLLNRTVAVKEVLLPELTSAQKEIRLKQALREGMNAAAFADHPNIVTVYDVVLEAGSPWIVMQLVKGRSLRHVLRDPTHAGVPDDQEVRLVPLPVSQVAAIAGAMVDALGAMHGAGLVHRDIKPHNIMLADDGRVLLTDFGIAKAASDTATLSGAVVGTLAYLAPERAEGEPGTAASDLFSLGVTLFEAVEGFSPFERRNSVTGTLTAILTKPLPPMTRAGPLIPLIHALTLKLPAQRPTHAQARHLLAAGAASPLPPVTVFPDPARRHVQWRGSRKTEVVAGVVGALVLLIAGVIGAVNQEAKQHAAERQAACATWGAAVQQQSSFFNANPTASITDNSSDIRYSTNAAAEEERMASAETHAESQTADQTLQAAFQQAASDRHSMAAVFQTFAAGNNDTSGYNQFARAESDDEARIQGLCNNG